MEWLHVALPFAAGLLLRLGIPLFLTLGLAWLLRRLDARWQAEARQLVSSGKATPARVLVPRCWLLKDCPPERRRACPAFPESEVPCWQLFRDKQGRMLEMCLSCDVFLRAPVPQPA